MFSVRKTIFYDKSCNLGENTQNIFLKNNVYFLRFLGLLIDGLQ